MFVGVDYGAILEQVEAEWDVLLFDGGNNDLSFYRPTVHLVVADRSDRATKLAITRVRRTSGWPMRC